MAQAESSLRNADNHPHALYELAKLLMRSSRGTEALQVLDRLRDQHPFAIEYLLLRARVHEELGELEEASRLRDLAEYNSRHHPTDDFVLSVERIRNSLGLRKKVKDAQEFLRSNQVEQALRILNEVESAGWDQPALLLTAMAELKRSNPRRAIELLEGLLADRGHFPQAMLLLGDAYLADGNTEKAREVWESTAEIRSGIALHERLSKLYHRTNELEKSARHNALRLHAVGIAELRNSQTSLAANAFQQAIHEDVSFFSSWFYLAECHRLSGRLKPAEEAYRRCLDIAPNHGRARDRLDRLSSH